MFRDVDCRLCEPSIRNGVRVGLPLQVDKAAQERERDACDRRAKP